MTSLRCKTVSGGCTDCSGTPPDVLYQGLSSCGEHGCVCVSAVLRLVSACRALSASAEAEVRGAGAVAQSLWVRPVIVSGVFRQGGGGAGSGCQTGGILGGDYQARLWNSVFLRCFLCSGLGRLRGGRQRRSGRPGFDRRTIVLAGILGGDYQARLWNSIFLRCFLCSGLGRLRGGRQRRSGRPGFDRRTIVLAGIL